MLDLPYIGRYMGIIMYMNLMSMSLSHQLSQHDGLTIIIANVFQLSQMHLIVRIFKLRLPNHHS